jgi:hypothetical protein
MRNINLFKYRGRIPGERHTVVAVCASFFDGLRAVEYLNWGCGRLAINRSLRRLPIGVPTAGVRSDIVEVIERPICESIG